MSETYRPRDDFERSEAQSLLKRMDDLIRVLSRIAPADFINRPATGPTPESSASGTQGSNEEDDKATQGEAKRPRRRPIPEPPASPYDLAKLLGVNMGGPRSQRPPDLSPSPASTFIGRAAPQEPATPGSFSYPIDVTPPDSVTSRGTPAIKSNLPSPIGPSPVDLALNPGKLDRIANNFVEAVLDVIDIKQRMSAASIAGVGGKSGNWGQNGPNGPWGPFTATNYRTYAAGGSAGAGGAGGSGGGNGRTGSGSTSGGNWWRKNPFGGGAWAAAKKAASKATSGAGLGTKSPKSGSRAWNWGKHASRAWQGWSGSRYKNAATKTYGAARFAGASVGVAGLISRVAGPVAVVASAVKGVYDVTQALKASSEKQFQTGRRLAAYNGEIAGTFAMTDIQEGFRNRALAKGTSDTYRTLGGVVNLNRNYQVNQDVLSTNLQNRAGILAGTAASGAQFMFSEVSKGLNKLFDRWDPGGKGTEAFGLEMWKMFYGMVDWMSGYKANDPNSWTNSFQQNIDNARKTVNLFDFNGFMNEAKSQKPLRANLQIKL